MDLEWSKFAKTAVDEHRNCESGRGEKKQKLATAVCKTTNQTFGVLGRVTHG